MWSEGRVFQLHTHNYYSDSVPQLWDLEAFSFFKLMIKNAELGTPSVQFSLSVMSDSLWTNDCSTPGFPVHQQLPEFTQTHVHWVGGAIQPFHPLSSSSPPAFNLSQHQGFFQRVSSSNQVAEVLEFQLQHQSFQRTLRIDFL